MHLGLVVSSTISKLKLYDRAITGRKNAEQEHILFQTRKANHRNAYRRLITGLACGLLCLSTTSALAQEAPRQSEAEFQ